MAILVALPSATTILPSAAAHCGPPCGPIPVVVEIQPKMEGLLFGPESTLVLDAVVSYHVDVDYDGFWYDPQENPELSFRLNRAPAWIEVTFDPPSYTVPVNDPAYLSQEGDEPGQVQYHWEAPVVFTVTKLRDPTPEELASTSRDVYRDGTVRATVTASTTSSLMGADVFGNNMGLQEGYGVRSLRFIPEINEVPWVMVEGQLVPQYVVMPNATNGGDAPGLGLPAALISVVGIAVAWRRRRSD